MKISLARVGFGLAVGVVLVGLFQNFKGCIPTKPSPDERLKDNEQERIAVTDRGDVVHVKRTAKGGQVAYRNTGAGKTIVTIDKQGNVKVTQETKGFVFRPGLCVGTGADGFRTGADVQFFYWRNFGFNGGITLLVRDNHWSDPRVHLSASYRLPLEVFRNTSVYLGVDTSKDLVTGLRVRF